MVSKSGREIRIVNDEKKGFRALGSKAITSEVKFMKGTLTIRKLTVKEVKSIQDLAAEVKDDAERGLDLIKHVIRVSADGAADTTNEEFDEMPMDELSKLSSEIMKFSGFGGDEKGK